MIDRSQSADREMAGPMVRWPAAVAVLTFGLAVLLAGTVGTVRNADAQNVKCRYNGNPYPPGTTMSIGGKMQVCRDTGIWQHLDYGGAESGIGCYLGEKYLRPGQTLCSEGVQVRCGGNGQWGPTGQKC